MTLPAILFRERADDDRGAERFRVRLGALWLDHGPGAQELTILDVSASGFLLETDQSLSSNSRIIVELPDDVCKACHVVWSSGRFYGAVFAEHLSTAELERIVGASPVVWPTFREEDRPVSSSRRTDHQQPERYHPNVGEYDKLPLATRGRIIFGSSAVLWGTIGALIWVTVW